MDCIVQGVAKSQRRLSLGQCPAWNGEEALEPGRCGNENQGPGGDGCKSVMEQTEIGA